MSWATWSIVPPSGFSGISLRASVPSRDPRSVLFSIGPEHLASAPPLSRAWFAVIAAGAFCVRRNRTPATEMSATAPFFGLLATNETPYIALSDASIVGQISATSASGESRWTDLAAAVGSPTTPVSPPFSVHRPDPAPKR